MKPVKQPDRTPAIGTVAIHPAQILAKCNQLTALNPPDKIPTPVVAPTIHMVVETGIPN